MEIMLGSKTLRRDGPPLVMAEIGVNHDGDLAKGTALVEAAAAAGCDAVKFQLFSSRLLVSQDAQLVAYQKRAGEESAQEMLASLEMPAEKMVALVRRAKELAMAAVVTPFSPELVADCTKMGVDAIKLASPDLVNRPLLEAAAETGLPLILSTGAAELAEIERTVGWLWKCRAAQRSVLLHCVSSYPTPADRASLGAISLLRQRFPEMPIGYSDHTIETQTASLAAACGACLLEKHLTLDRRAKGPDHAASLEPPQMAEYVQQARLGFQMRGPFEKSVQPGELGVREQTRQSVVARSHLPAGTVLSREMLTVKRPGTGIPAADLCSIIGKALLRDVPADRVLHWTDVDAGENA